jgi:3-phenylpropionate/cinnamic acid dioxygenase small subunit
MTHQTQISHQAITDFLVLEAELIDDRRFAEWHELFTDDAAYTVPLADGADPRHQALIVNDDALRLDERVYHLSQVPFPSQSPRSRTLHVIGNVRVRPETEAEAGDRISVVSNQIICEMRLGDFRQVGLGEQRVLAARVEHDLVPTASAFKIASKCVRLIDRGAAMSNLTFLL